MNQYRRKNSGFGIGVFLILLGTLWILNNAEVFNFRINRWWPLILVAVGIMMLNKRQWRPDVGSVLVTGFGVLFFLTENHFVDRHEAWKYWPLALIIIGASFILGKNEPKSDQNDKNTYESHTGFGSQSEGSQAGAANTSSEDQIQVECSFASVTKQIVTPNFKGGTVSTSFGNVVIDLRSSQLSEDGAKLYVNSSFGGIEIRIPANWFLEARTSATLGNVHHRCCNPRATEGKRLIINANAVMGNIELLN